MPLPEASRLQSRRVRAGGHVLYTRASAEAPRLRAEGAVAVVLVHGLVISSVYMVPTARRLAPCFPVYAPDLPGFGRSTKPARVLDVRRLAEALRTWMDALGLRRAVLIGNSLGCQVLVDLAARHPERVAAAVLAGPTVDRHARGALPQIGRLMKDAPREAPSLIPLHVRDCFRAGLPRAWGTLRHALRDPVEEKLPHVQAPALVVRGGRDPLVPRRWAEEVAALLPRGRFETIPGAPHAVNYSAPAPFVQRIRTFLRTCGLHRST